MARRRIIAGFLFALTSIVGAQAADMPGTWAPPAIIAPPYSELTSGWYVRFDAAYNWNSIGTIDSGIPVTSIKFQSSPDIGAGFGYKYQWMRFELSLDRGFPSAVRAATGAAVTQPQYSSKVSWITALGNAYIDMGTWWGFTPYVGAGIGATRLHSADYLDTLFVPVPNASTKADSTNFSWAVMAGVSFQITPRWAVDLGYRYLDLGQIHNTTSSFLPVDYADFRKVSTQEVRIGVRFLID